jgi:chromosome segregation ATPase
MDRALSERLQRTLAELEQQLTEIEDLDPEARLALAEARHDIEAVLERKEAPRAEVVARLNEALSNFHVRHPALTELARKVSETLADMGF